MDYFYITFQLTVDEGGSRLLNVDLYLVLLSLFGMCYVIFQNERISCGGF